MIKFALAGNPNSGKTTLFNTLTGSTAHVGNWPGVTVDKREGTYKKLSEKVQIVDLPGIYSLSPYTPEEVVTRNFILDEKPECVINIVDATNLERNLYLTTQILEIDVPVIVALNMIDAVKANGDKINIKELSNRLGVPIVEISALKKQGTDELMKVAYGVAKCGRNSTTVLQESIVGPIIDKVNEALPNDLESKLFHAIKLIEGDELEVAAHPEANKIAVELKAKIGDEFEGDYEAVIADRRYDYISKHFTPTVVRAKKQGMTKSDKIDKVMTHRVWAIPLFLVIMFAVFHFVFSEDLLFLNAIFGLEIKSEGAINFFTGMGYEGEALGGIPSLGVFLQSWVGFVFDYLGALLGRVLPDGTWYASLIIDGLIGGVGAVASFIPQILLLFLFISILEDSGYMARVAFIMDRAFRKIGLSGKAFIPMLMGFGCSVPAMMAARTLQNEQERDRTIRLSICFSCGAKAPIWAMLAGVAVLGGILGDLFVFGIYLLGIVIAIVSALIMKLFSKSNEIPPFIMELPAYHAPQFKNLMAHLWEKFKHYVYKAATIIAASTVVLWFLSNFSWAFWTGMVDIEESILADVGRGLQYIFYPLGWAIGEDGWKYSVATITGLIAKEDVVATCAVFGLTEGTIGLSVAGIFAFAAYNLFTLPCMAAVATAKGESTKKGFWITVAWWFASSYIISMVIYWMIALYEVAIWAGLLVTFVLVALIITAGMVVWLRIKKHSSDKE
ncbi:MAG: ferrous iron transporter B [Clostridiales bacterium]|nr:ferrous iron transporter B [Clostridiales bacterium]